MPNDFSIICIIPYRIKNPPFNFFLSAGRTKFGGQKVRRSCGMRRVFVCYNKIVQYRTGMGGMKMAKENSFDVVSRVDMQEVANAVNQASKEISTRYDFRGSKSSIVLDKEQITLLCDDDFKLRLVREILSGKLVKRSVPLKNIRDGKKENAAGSMVRQILDIQMGLSKDQAKEIVKLVKGSGLKVSTQIQDTQVRVSGKDKDTLQETIAYLKKQDFPVELQFVNFR